MNRLCLTRYLEGGKTWVLQPSSLGQHISGSQVNSKCCCSCVEWRDISCKISARSVFDIFCRERKSRPDLLYPCLVEEVYRMLTLCDDTWFGPEFTNLSLRVPVCLEEMSRKTIKGDTEKLEALILMLGCLIPRRLGRSVTLNLHSNMPIFFQDSVSLPPVKETYSLQAP